MLGGPSRTGEERLPWVIIQNIINRNAVASLFPFPRAFLL
jgi:hypothetical protein